MRTEEKEKEETRVTESQAEGNEEETKGNSEVLMGC